MEVHDSLAITALKPYNRANYTRISPGVVGPVGDVLMQTRLKQSMPSLDMRFDKLGGKDGEVRMGANISDGMIRAFSNGGGLARVRDTNWEAGRHFRTHRGWIYQDMRKPDKRIEPYLGKSGPRFDWNNRLATVYKSLHTGDKFLPLPGEYALSPGELPRNGNTPGFYVEGDTVTLEQAGPVQDGKVVDPRKPGKPAQPGTIYGTKGWGTPGGLDPNSAYY
jgi:hypothetical protein